MLLFSKIEVEKFRHGNKHLRYGQAFYYHFKLDRVVGQDKAFCDKLYAADENTVRAMVASRIDKKQ